MTRQCGLRAQAARTTLVARSKSATSSSRSEHRRGVRRASSRRRSPRPRTRSRRQRARAVIRSVAGPSGVTTARQSVPSGSRWNDGSPSPAPQRAHDVVRRARPARAPHAPIAEPLPPVGRTPPVVVTELRVTARCRHVGRQCTMSPCNSSELVETSAAVAATRSRLAKRDALARLLQPGRAGRHRDRGRLSGRRAAAAPHRRRLADPAIAARPPADRRR